MLYFFLIAIMYRYMRKGSILTTESTLFKVLLPLSQVDWRKSLEILKKLRIEVKDKALTYERKQLLLKAYEVVFISCATDNQWGVIGKLIELLNNEELSFFIPFSRLIDICRINSYYKTAQEIFDCMKQALSFQVDNNTVSIKSLQGYKPCLDEPHLVNVIPLHQIVESYASLIGIYAKVGKFKEALDFYDELKSLHTPIPMKPSLCLSVLEACRDGPLELAKETFSLYNNNSESGEICKDLQNDFVEPFSYRTKECIKTLKKKQVLWNKESVSRGILTALIRAHVKPRALESALEYFENFKSTKSEISNVIVSCILFLFQEAELYREAINFYKQNRDVVYKLDMASCEIVRYCADAKVKKENALNKEGRKELYPY
jgi:pentatricopeptide repeat protein